MIKKRTKLVNDWVDGYDFKVVNSWWCKDKFVKHSGKIYYHKDFVIYVRSTETSSGSIEIISYKSKSDDDIKKLERMFNKDKDWAIEFSEEFGR